MAYNNKIIFISITKPFNYIMLLHDGIPQDSDIIQYVLSGDVSMDYCGICHLFFCFAIDNEFVHRCTHKHVYYMIVVYDGISLGSDTIPCILHY